MNQLLAFKPRSRRQFFGGSLNRTLSGRSLLAVFTILCAGTCDALEPSSDWLGFRGDGRGVATAGPTTLAIGDDGNRAWKRSMPGRSVAGPVIVGDLVVSTSSSGPDEEDLFITGLNLSDGVTRWEQRFRATGRPYFHPTSANAAPSPASDGERIVAFFSSNDLACVSVDGQLLWYRGLGRDYPKTGNDVGMASSPVIAGDTVVVQVECQGDSFAAGIDLATGENLWRIQRPAMSNWSSPVALSTGSSSPTVILQSREDLIAVDARSGKVQWSFDEGRDAIASATVVGDRLLSPGGDLIAYRLTGKNETPTELWRENQLSPRNASVVSDGERLYSLKGSVLLRGDLETGEIVWKTRLSGLGSTWATPVVAEDRIYVFDQTGLGLIIQDGGDEAEITTKVQLEEGVLGTPALANGKLVVRSKTMLHCFK
ncbi:outer membrane protein assembly factor BamB family protein [Neorhodopirellula pilleata]|uniref:Outer membrane biogenesis protein BamB n=1 Tax=Neorhodopirellula pilleata TaxID=2714738 RepID=A0A5C6AR07_9BACT|nr:PQQ-binding-like beta-propeller repeat protein [Neorhodopirellula pilleata]TWU01927.1 outer membrane biogenesis protein BamB [Neorhodopirellula pilleata]